MFGLPSGSRRAFAVIVMSALAATACGDDGAAAPESTPLGNPEMCAYLDAEAPDEGFVDTVPEQYRTLARAIVDVAATESDVGEGDEMREMLSSADAAPDLAGLADVVDGTCGESEASVGLRGFATMAEMGAADAATEYCDVLSGSLAADDSDGVPPEVLALAPESHVVAFEQIDRADEGDADALAMLGPAFAGLGLYLENRCGQADAFIEFFVVGALAGAFASMGDGTGDGPSDIDPQAEPGDVDLAPVTDAVPAGVDLSFSAATFALEEDGEYLVQAAVPTGWEQSDSLFGVSFEPTEEFDIFTELSFDTGCDGLCQLTDWEARLTGPEGFLTRSRDGVDLLRDDPVADGVVLVSEGFADGIDARVIRWNDSADRYLSCEAELGEGDVALLDAFIAVCTTAVPGWFPVS